MKLKMIRGLKNMNCVRNSLKLAIMHYRLSPFLSSRNRNNGKSPLMLAGVNTRGINWITYCQREHHPQIGTVALRTDIANIFPVVSNPIGFASQRLTTVTFVGIGWAMISRTLEIRISHEGMMVDSARFTIAMFTGADVLLVNWCANPTSRTSISLTLIPMMVPEGA